MRPNPPVSLKSAWCGRRTSEGDLDLLEDRAEDRVGGDALELGLGPELMRWRQTEGTIVWRWSGVTAS